MSCKNDVVLSVMELFVRAEEYIKAPMTLQMLNHMIIKLRLYTVSKCNLLTVFAIDTNAVQ